MSAESVRLLVQCGACSRMLEVHEVVNGVCRGRCLGPRGSATEGKAGELVGECPCLGHQVEGELERLKRRAQERRDSIERESKWMG
jgi:hypothetical protein